MIKTIADQYLAQNAGRRYPFRDDTKLPDWLTDAGVLDFRCTLFDAPAGTVPEARLVSVAHTGDGNVSFTVDLSAGGVVVDTIQFTVPANIAGAPYTAYASGDRSTGALTVTEAAIPPAGIEEWQNPYVTDGLIGLWDGEWNVAGGQHDDLATTWADISGNNRDAVLNGTYSWGTNYWHVESVSGHGLATWPAQDLGSGQTVEFVIDPITSIGYGRIIAEAAFVASPIVFNNYPGTLYMYGYGLDTSYTVTGIIPGFDNKEKHLHQIVHPSGGPMKYYIDGILCWSQRTSWDCTGGELGYFANNSALTRGIDADYFTMRRYNRVLTDAELAANRAVDKERFDLQ